MKIVSNTSDFCLLCYNTDDCRHVPAAGKTMALLGVNLGET